MLLHSQPPNQKHQIRFRRDRREAVFLFSLPPTGRRSHQTPIEIQFELQCMSPLVADSVEKVRVSTRLNFLSAVGAFFESRCGRPHRLQLNHRGDL
jgi:hypothetical protein